MVECGCRRLLGRVGMDGWDVEEASIGMAAAGMEQGHRGCTEAGL